MLLTQCLQYYILSRKRSFDLILCGRASDNASASAAAQCSSKLPLRMREIVAGIQYVVQALAIDHLSKGGVAVRETILQESKTGYPTH